MVFTPVSTLGGAKPHEMGACARGVRATRYPSTEIRDRHFARARSSF
jgi:hypothetical protein